MMRVNKAIAILVALAAAGVLFTQRAEEHPSHGDSPQGVVSWLEATDWPQARVERVVDGDTIILQYKGKRERLRYIGLDTPERLGPNTEAECYGDEAREVNAELVTDRVVYLEFDAELRDQYDRLLAYVYLSDGTMVNAHLLERGFATTLSIPPNLKYASRFRDLARGAEERELGLWAACH